MSYYEIFRKAFDQESAGVNLRLLSDCHNRLWTRPIDALIVLNLAPETLGATWPWAGLLSLALGFSVFLFRRAEDMLGCFQICASPFLARFEVIAFRPFVPSVDEHKILL